MKTKLMMTLALAGLLAAGTTASTAFAAKSDEAQEANALQGAKVSLTQAIASAEQQTGGHAYDAGADVEKGKTIIVVETNGPKGVQTVTVDAESGHVLGTHAGVETD